MKKVSLTFILFLLTSFSLLTKSYSADTGEISSAEDDSSPGEDFVPEETNPKNTLSSNNQINQSLQKSICLNLLQNEENIKICSEKNDFNLEKLRTCQILTSSFVSEAICLKNDSLTAESVEDCFNLTNYNFEEAICLMGKSLSNYSSIQEIQKDIEDYIGHKVLLDESGLLLFHEKGSIQNIFPSPKSKEDGIAASGHGHHSDIVMWTPVVSMRSQ